MNKLHTMTLCALLMSTATVAYGQDAEVDTTAQPVSEETADGGLRLQGVTVSANRREQDNQTVPVTVSVLSSEAVENMGVLSTQDLAVAVPGVNFTKLFNGAAFYVRGVGKGDTNTGQELPIAVYVDGVYVATSEGSIFSFNNIERVEVLKGPQGTLFGRNATGGVVQVITRTPSHDTSADISLGYGSYDKFEGNLYATTGLSDDIAVDLAVYSSDQGEGWGTNVATGTDIYYDREVNVRSKLFWTPTDTTSITLAAKYADVLSDIGTANANYPGTVGFGGYENPGFYNINSEQGRPRSGYISKGLSLHIEQDLPWAKLVSISSYQDNEEHVRGYDNDGSDVFGIVAERDAPSKTFTQELQLQSLPSSSIQWIGGVYYLDQEVALDQLHLSGLYLGAGPDFVLSRYASQDTQSVAAFGEITFPLFSDDTHLTLGGRYTKDERSLEAQDFDTFGSAYPVINQSEDWSSPTWRIVLDHQFTPDIFGYASYSRGFKSGQFNLVAPGTPPVDPEELDAYEIGLKTKLFNQRLILNTAAYYYEYSDIQLTQRVAAGNVLYNAAVAEMTGLDVDFQALLTENLSLQGGFALIDGEYAEFPAAPFYTPQPGGGNLATSFDAAGQSLVNTPEFQASIGPTYTTDLFGGELSLATRYAYNSGFYFAPGNRLEQPEYHMLNASIGWTSTNETWGVRLWGRNLLDEEIVSYNSEGELGDFYSVSAPQTVGATLTFHFGD